MWTTFAVRASRGNRVLSYFLNFHLETKEKRFRSQQIGRLAGFGHLGDANIIITKKRVPFFHSEASKRFLYSYPLVSRGFNQFISAYGKVT